LPHTEQEIGLTDSVCFWINFINRILILNYNI
jgi:hypothetical protein